MVIIKCDKAVVMPDVIVNNNGSYMFVENDEYKYLSSFPVVEDDGYALIASKDMRNWCLCVGAFFGDEYLIAQDIVKHIQEIDELGGTKFET